MKRVNKKWILLALLVVSISFGAKVKVGDVYMRTDGMSKIVEHAGRHTTLKLNSGDLVKVEKTSWFSNKVTLRVVSSKAKTLSGSRVMGMTFTDRLDINAVGWKVFKAKAGSTSNNKKTAILLKKASKKFLKKNAKKAGVISTKSGLQYKIIVKGTGATPQKSDFVNFHILGTLIDGTEIMNSYKQGKPGKVELSSPTNLMGVINALQIMPVGSKWKLFIPPDLAFGDKEIGPIRAHSVLIVELELLSID